MDFLASPKPFVPFENRWNEVVLRSVQVLAGNRAYMHYPCLWIVGVLQMGHIMTLDDIGIYLLISRELHSCSVETYLIVQLSILYIV